MYYAEARLNTSRRVKPPYQRIEDVYAINFPEANFTHKFQTGDRGGSGDLRIWVQLHLTAAQN